ncbi:uncharacterized protein LOC114305242, partial [Camellia sinensis]|uniref:uncharacterized protein LOC114305242 n=1 Tax=Camellia sinensis TaxID=4442 RepID=UPI001036EC0B
QKERERFLGLNSKDSVVFVKEEAVEGCKDSAFSTGSSSLTIFYAGTVNVYNDISPEKAQAIHVLGWKWAF